MANAARGEVTLRCGDRTLTLCLTLGALAEIETLLAGGRGLETLTARDVLAVLRALLTGGGEHEAAARVETLPIGLMEAAAAISAALAAAGPG